MEHGGFAHPSRQLQEPRNQSKGTQVDFDNLPRLPFQQTTGYPFYVFPSDLGDLSRENVLHEATTFFCKQPDRMLKLISAFHDEEGRQKVTLEKSLRGILKKWQDAKYHCAFQDMQEVIEDYHDQNPHLPLPQLLWPDFAFPANIYDPAKWCDRDRYSQLDENGEVPSWLSITATQLAPPLDSLNNDELNSNSADSVHPDRERDSCKKTTQINFSS